MAFVAKRRHGRIILLVLGNEMLSVVYQRVIIFKSITVVGIDVKIKDSFVYCEVYFLNLFCESIVAPVVCITTAVAAATLLTADFVLPIITITHIAMIRIHIHQSAPPSAVYCLKRKIKLTKKCSAAKSYIGSIGLPPLLIR